MRPPLNLLESLIAIKEQGSHTRAADLLNMTQPSLSMQLKRLEGYFNFPLFEIQGKKKVLTRYGEEIYSEAKRILNEINRGFETIDRKYLDESKMLLRIGGRRELLFSLQKKLKFRGRINFDILTSSEAVRALESGIVDLAVSRHRPDSSNFVAKKFITTCPWLITNQKWIVGKKSEQIIYDKKFLCRTPVIVYSEKGDLMLDWLRHVGLNIGDLNIKFVSPDWLNILQMVEGGLGYAVVPDSVESNLDSIVQIELPCSIVKAETYYYLYNRTLIKIPVFAELIKSL